MCCWKGDGHFCGYYFLVKWILGGQGGDRTDGHSGRFVKRYSYCMEASFQEMFLAEELEHAVLGRKIYYQKESAVDA
jgi:hypothetical protein